MRLICSSDWVRTNYGFDGAVYPYSHNLGAAHSLANGDITSPIPKEVATDKKPYGPVASSNERQRHLVYVVTLL